MDITLKQARALRDALEESSPELIVKWRTILGMNNEENKEEASDDK